MLFLGAGQVDFGADKWFWQSTCPSDKWIFKQNLSPDWALGQITIFTSMKLFYGYDNKHPRCRTYLHGLRIATDIRYV